MRSLGALPRGYHVIQGCRHHGGSHGLVGLARTLTPLRQVLHRARSCVRLDRVELHFSLDYQSTGSTHLHPMQHSDPKALEVRTPSQTREGQALESSPEADCSTRQHLKAYRTWSSRMAGAAEAAASGPLLGRARWAGAACGRTEIPGIRCARAVHLVSGVGAGCPAAGQGGQTSTGAADKLDADKPGVITGQVGITLTAHPRDKISNAAQIGAIAVI